MTLLSQILCFLLHSPQHLFMRLFFIGIPTTKRRWNLAASSDHALSSWCPLVLLVFHADEQVCMAFIWNSPHVSSSALGNTCRRTRIDLCLGHYRFGLDLYDIHTLAHTCRVHIFLHLASDSIVSHPGLS